MKIGLITAYDENMAEMAELSLLNKREYAQKHGYALVAVTEGFDRARSPAWSKLKFIRDHLAGFDWLLWIDIDTVIMNLAVKIEDYLDQSCDIIAGLCAFMEGIKAPGLFDVTIHTGCFLVKNTPWAFQFLLEVDNCREHYNTELREETAFTDLYIKGDKDYRRHFKLLKFSKFCSAYPTRFFMDKLFASMIYKKGDFLVHFLKMNNQEKTLAMQKVMKKRTEYVQ